MLDFICCGNFVNCIHLNIVLGKGLAQEYIGYCFVEILNEEVFFFLELCQVYT